MLPGLRFLFAAIVLSISLLIFGLGAAALLRAAHQEIASVPSRPAPPERVFAKQGDAALPTLSMLRIDTQTADEDSLDRPATDNIQPAAQPEILPSTVAATAERLAAEPESIAVSAMPNQETQNLKDVPPSGPVARDDAAAYVQTPPVAEALIALEVPRASEAPSETLSPSPVETNLAMIENVTPPPADQAAPTESHSTSAATLTADDAAIKIATLGGPPVAVEIEATPTKAKQKSRDGAIKKRLQAERTAQRRKVARRAIALRRASQAAADPFAQPFGGFPGLSSRGQ